MSYEEGKIEMKVGKNSTTFSRVATLSSLLFLFSHFVVMVSLAKNKIKFSSSLLLFPLGVNAVESLCSRQNERNFLFLSSSFVCALFSARDVSRENWEENRCFLVVVLKVFLCTDFSLLFNIAPKCTILAPLSNDAFLSTLKFDSISRWKTRQRNLEKKKLFND